MTKEQFEQLQPWEKTIMNAYKNSFVHMSGSDFLKVANIYAEVYGHTLTKSQMNCNTCRLNALKRLGKDYTEFKAKLENPAQEEKPTKKSNKGRKPKINIDENTE